MQINTHISTKTYFLLMIFAIIIGIIVIGSQLKTPIEIYILKNANISEATITRSYNDLVGHGYDEHYMWKIEYQYMIDDKLYTGEDYTPWKFSTFKNDIGDKIKIYYYKDNYEKSGVYHISYLFIAIGIILILGMVRAFIERKNYYKI